MNSTLFYNHQSNKNDDDNQYLLSIFDEAFTKFS